MTKRFLPLLLLVISVFAQGPMQTTTGSDKQNAAYEVVTIKLPGSDEYAPPLRVYIQRAFGLPANTQGLVVGPEWINGTKYVIKGKPPESIQGAMQSMSAEERMRETRLMMQSLLADRFRLKAHFETREMLVYRLTVAKGGMKLKENTDMRKRVTSVGASRVTGTAVPMRAFVDALETVPDIEGRLIVDNTGLNGTYDFALKWSPLSAAAVGSPDVAMSASAETISLFTAIEDQLGLKLTAVKDQGQVLVIDHIEKPSEN